jgi:hypothetical protein
MDMQGSSLLVSQITAVHVEGDYAFVGLGNPRPPSTFVFKRISAERGKTNDEPVDGDNLRHCVPAPVARQLISLGWLAYHRIQDLFLQCESGRPDGNEPVRAKGGGDRRFEFQSARNTANLAP